MRTDLELRVLHGVAIRLKTTLNDLSDGEAEPIAFGFVSRSTPSSAVILRDLVALPEGSRVAGQFESAWSHRATIAMANEAERRGCGLVILHRHLGSGVPRLSRVDEENFAALAASLCCLFPTLTFGSVVLSSDWHAFGRLATPDGPIQIARIRWLGGSIDKLPAPPPIHRDREKPHDAMWGCNGEGKLRAARIGVIGAGGGGSHVIQQLAHAGIGAMVSVDDDTLDIGNRSRTVGTRPSDVGRHKIDAMERLANDAGDDIRFQLIAERFPSAEAVRALGACDLLISCLDTHRARRDVMEFAWQHAIPLIDIGLAIDVPESGRGVRAIGGHVFIGIPGRQCIWCAGVLTAARLDAELDENGYVRGGGNAQVVSLNGTLASQAVTEALSLLTGFWGPDTEPPIRLVFDGRTMLPTVSRPRRCALCDRVGFGDVHWVPAATGTG